MWQSRKIDSGINVDILVLQPLRWHWMSCAIHYKRDVHETLIYMAQTSNNGVNTTCDFYCCLLPQCKALHTCCLPKAFQSQQRLFSPKFSSEIITVLSEMLLHRLSTW